MLKDREKILPPLWLALPEIERGSMGWRMGDGESYAEKWGAWYRALTEAEKAEYRQLFPEPAPWRGAMTDRKACPSRARGGISVELWQPDGKPKYTPEQFYDIASEEIVMFWRHHPARDGRTTKSCFSQWWMSPFRFYGLEMCCMEQGMMLGKARLFENEEIAKRILASNDPQVIKKLGRQVQPFDEALWNEIKYPLVVSGNYRKFSQNADLRNFLLSTGDSLLVEASPYDRVWGVGLGEEDPRALDPRQWRGENLLGFALMEVRDEIRMAYENADLCCEPWD